MTPVYRLSQAGSIKTGRTNYPNMGVGVASVAVPFAPTIGTATAGAGQASVAFTPSVIGASATTYTATSSPGGFTGSASSSPITVTGLTAGTAYTFTVTATNANGTSSASAASNSVTPTASNSWESIETFVVGAGGQTSITFGSGGTIPQTYKHLQIRALTMTSTASNGALLEFNNDTAANYKGHALYGSGSGTPAAGASSPIYIPFFMGGSTSPGAAIIDVLDYSSTTKYKTVRSLDGYDANGSGYIGLASGLWMSTNAITSIKFTRATFQQYSHFALYGIKG